MATIWETVPAERIREGDVLPWGTDGRVRVYRAEEHGNQDVRDHQGRTVLAIGVEGPTDRFERYHGMTSGMFAARDEPVRRMLPERAARVSDTNYRTLVR
jgi:hypothetical protein